MKDSKLHVLRSTSPGKAPAQVDEAIPRPAFHWRTRVLIPGLVLGGFVLLLVFTAREQFIPLVTVQAAPVVVKTGQGAVSGAVTVQAAGWIEADPYKSYVTALTDGVVRELLALEGEPVQKGQVVVRLVDEDALLAVQRARDKVKEFEATLAAEKAEQDAAKTEWENPVERTRAVAVSEAQVAESRAVMEQVAAEIAMEESNLEHARSQHDRAVGLHASGSVSEQEFVRLRSQFQAQASKIAALRMRLAATKELTAKHEADLRAAREHMTLRTEERRKLDAAQAATVKAEASLSQARTALDEAKLRLERMEIRSPMDGVVMSRLTEPGSKVVVLSDNPGSARVLSLYDPHRLQVRVDVPLADAAKVSVGQQAQIVVEVLPDRAFSGTVTRVLHEANVQKNTLEVKVAVADPDPTLRPEMLARVKFLARASAQPEQDGLRVFAPEAAIRGTGPNATVWVARLGDAGRGTVVSRSVKVGAGRANGWVDVTEGLQPGDMVVTSSVSDLHPGRKVKIDTD